MNAVARDDRIAVSAVLAHGRVARVEISARRPVGVGRLALGKPAEVMVALVPRLFALCAAAQGAAATLALSAARGEPLPSDVVATQAAAVLTERLIELLRGTITLLRDDQFAVLAPKLRDLIAAARRVDNRGVLDAEAIDSLDRGLDALGLPAANFEDTDAYHAWLRSDSPLALLHSALTPSHRAAYEGRGEEEYAQSRRCEAQTLDQLDFAAIPIDPLAAADDRMIGERLLHDGAFFAARPNLAGRVPETGALARLACHPLIRSVGSGLSGRSLARLIEARAAPQRLRALRRGGADAADLLRATSLGDGIGLGAVECARGRLYHLIALDHDGRIARYEILAPTEWNFHPEGPLARALVGTRLCVCEDDRKRLAALVAAFDPCVGFDVELRESADA